MQHNSLGFVQHSKPHARMVAVKNNAEPSTSLLIVEDENRIFQRNVANVRNFVFPKRTPEKLTEITESFLVGGFEDAVFLPMKYSLILLVEKQELKRISRTNLEKRHVLWIPTPDFSTPTALQLNNALSFALRELNAGKNIVVCCKSGKGRSVLCASYILSFLFKVSIREAHTYISVKRKVMPYAGIFSVNRWKYIQQVQSHTQSFVMTSVET